MIRRIDHFGEPRWRDGERNQLQQQCCEVLDLSVDCCLVVNCCSSTMVIVLNYDRNTSIIWSVFCRSTFFLSHGSSFQLIVYTMMSHKLATVYKLFSLNYLKQFLFQNGLGVTQTPTISSKYVLNDWIMVQRFRVYHFFISHFFMS